MDASEPTRNHEFDLRQAFRVQAFWIHPIIWTPDAAPIPGPYPRCSQTVAPLCTVQDPNPGPLHELHSKNFRPAREGFARQCSKS